MESIRDEMKTKQSEFDIRMQKWFCLREALLCKLEKSLLALAFHKHVFFHILIATIAQTPTRRFTFFFLSPQNANSIPFEYARVYVYAQGA